METLITSSASLVYFPQSVGRFQLDSSVGRHVKMEKRALDSLADFLAQHVFDQYHEEGYTLSIYGDKISLFRYGTSSLGYKEFTMAAARVEITHPFVVEAQSSSYMDYDSGYEVDDVTFIYRIKQ